MATYADLFALRNNADLRNKVAVAVIVKAQDLAASVPTTNEKAWISKAFASPSGEATRVFSAVLAANKDLTVAQISAATDVAIQTNVDAIVAIFVDADAGV